MCARGGLGYWTNPPLFFARGSLLTLKHGKKVGGLLAISSN